jgi:hypothetical protein
MNDPSIGAEGLAVLRPRADLSILACSHYGAVKRSQSLIAKPHQLIAIDRTQCHVLRHNDPRRGVNLNLGV